MSVYRDPINTMDRCGSVFCRPSEDPHVVNVAQCDPIADGCKCVATATMLEPCRKGLDDLVPNVLYEAQGLPAEVAADYIREAVIDAMRDLGGVRRRWIIEAQECVTDYYPHTVAAEEIEVIEKVWIDGVPVHAAPLDEAAYSEPVTCANGLVARYRFEDPDQLNIYLPDQPGNCPAQMIEIEGTVVACEDACIFDCDFLKKNARVIRHLALSKLFGIAGRKWSSPGLTIRHENLYQQHRDRELNRQLKNRRGRGPHTVLTGRF